MTESPEPTQAPDEQSSLSDETIEAAADDEQVTDMRAVKRLRAENARLRHRLREAEENRGAAEARLDAMRRAEVERLAGEVLVDGSDLYRHGVDEQALFDEEFGEIVPDAVRDAARAIAEQRPHLARPPQGKPPTDRPVEGLRPGASPEPAKPTAPSWAQALRGG